MNEAGRINLKHLRAFRAVAEHKHFTRASDAIGLSQPALSALISQLEQDLSVRLLTRTTRAVELTPAGREFLAATTRILTDINQALSETRDHAALARGRLRIAALPSLCAGLLPDLLARFHATYPGVSISVHDLPADEIAGAALTRQVDFGIGFAPGGDSGGHQAILVDRVVAVALRAWFPDAPQRLSWRELARHEVIAMEHGTSVRRLIDAGAHQADVALRILLEPRQMASAIAYARAGLGVAILPSSGVKVDGDDRLILLDLVEPVIERTLSVIRPAEVELAPPAEALLTMLRAHIAERGIAVTGFE